MVFQARASIFMVSTYLFFMQKRRHRFIMYLHGKFNTTPMFCTSKFSCSGGRVEATVYCRCCQVPSKMENQRTGAIASRPLPTLSDSSPLGGGAATFVAPPRFARSASFHGGAPKSLADKIEVKSTQKGKKLGAEMREKIAVAGLQLSKKPCAPTLYVVLIECKLINFFPHIFLPSEYHSLPLFARNFHPEIVASTPGKA